MFVPGPVLPDEMKSRSGRWIVVDDRQRVLLDEGRLPEGTTAPVEADTVHVLGHDIAGPVFAVAAATPAPDGEWIDLRGLFGVLDDAEWVLAGRGAQVLTWDRDHRFCGRCGTPTERHETERARVCPGCRAMAFPRLSPAVIMLVERDGPTGPEVLLAWGRQFPGRFFSALAGFVEPGESLEQCVAREVLEETGIEVDDIRYFGSQPWPFPHSLMIGFNARYVSGEITIQEEEIVEAGWFGPNELPPVPRGGMSIAGWLLEDWLTRVTA